MEKHDITSYSICRMQRFFCNTIWIDDEKTLRGNLKSGTQVKDLAMSYQRHVWPEKTQCGLHDFCRAL